MNSLGMVYGNGMLLALVLIEAMIIKFKLKKELPIKELVMNLNSGHVLLWVFRSLEVAAYAFTLNYISTKWLVNVPYFLIWVIAFFLWDFMFYWLHRTHHHWKWLWVVHVVHHEGEHFSLSLGIRNSWYSSLTSFPYFFILAFLGIPTEVFIAVSSFHYFVQFYNHNHLVKNSGWLEKLLVTPAHHKVHHGKNDPYIDKNFGGTFILWDKLFGTFQQEEKNNPVQIGIDEIVDSNNPVFVNNVPLIKKIIPGYNFNLHKNQISVPNSFVVIGTIMLFMLLLNFIYFEHSLTSFYYIFLFFTIFIGTIAIGLLLDGKLIGTLALAISTIFAPLYLWVNFPNPNAFFLITLTVYSTHGILTLFYLLFSWKSNFRKKIAES